MTLQTSPRTSRDAVPSRQPGPTRACSARLMTPILHADRPARNPPAHKRPLFSCLHHGPLSRPSPRPGRKQAACPASVDPCQALCHPALVLSCGKCWRGHERGLWCHTHGGLLLTTTHQLHKPGFAPDHSEPRHGSDGKECTRDAGDPGSIPGSGRSPGGGNGNPLQCSCLGNRTERGAWGHTVHGVVESDTTEQLTLSEPHLWTKRRSVPRTGLVRRGPLSPRASAMTPIPSPSGPRALVLADSLSEPCVTASLGTRASSALPGSPRPYLEGR